MRWRPSASLIALALSLLTPEFATPADPVRAAQWFVDYLGLARAHQISAGEGVTIGLPDSGVFPHVDLRGNLIRGTDLVGDGDATGQTDRAGHGTHMAGVMAGHGHGTDEGVLGIAPRAKILPVRVSSTSTGGPDLDDGILWAARNGAEVINVSAVVARSHALNAALAAAEEADAVVVAAAGNRHRNVLAGYPASSPGVLAVGAINQQGTHADFSLAGAAVGICAPGTEIVTTGLRDGYREVDGTSAAAAIVSGAAALVRARFPELSARAVVHRLTSTATDIGAPGRDDECGHGVLNIVAALTAEGPPGNGAAKVATGGTGAERAGSPAPVALRGGAAIVGIGAVVVFLALRRRRRVDGPRGAF